MVELFLKKSYECYYCQEVYELEEDAEECECRESEPPEVITTWFYQCEGCKKIYEQKSQAQDCEELHETIENDPYHNIFVRKRLDSAANHKTQTKLIEILK